MNQKKLRKNFFPTLVITFFLWILVGGIIFFLDPETFLSIPLFFFSVFLALTFTLSLLWANTRRGFFSSALLTTFLILRYLGVGTIINFLLLLGLGVVAEYYFSKN